jgi:hypothetical protein
MVTAVNDPLVGAQTGSESSLSNWAGPYVTGMLAKGQAASNAPYQAYKGPLTAGTSGLQDQAFQGIAGLTVPTDQMGAFTPGTFDASAAQQYMNPYLQASLDPQIAEARRQSQITQMGNAAKATQAGAFGGSRGALMDTETQRNLGTNLAGITGAGYNAAFNNAQQQFNTEQGRGMEAQNLTNQYGLGALQKQADLGAVQRGIESEGVAADKTQFEEQRDYPLKSAQYQQSLLQGLPLATQNYSYQQPSALSNALGGASGATTLFNLLFGTPAVTQAPGVTTKP